MTRWIYRLAAVALVLVAASVLPAAAPAAAQDTSPVSLSPDSPSAPAAGAFSSAGKWLVTKSDRFTLGLLGGAAGCYRTALTEEADGSTVASV